MVLGIMQWIAIVFLFCIWLGDMMQYGNSNME
jgi:hypothetical protein